MRNAYLQGFQGIVIRCARIADLGTPWLMRNAVMVLYRACRSLDAPLVSPGRPTPFPIVREKPDVREGMSFNLANNIWGTNYIMWQPYAAQDDTIRFRFTIRAKQHDTSEPDSFQRVIKHEQSLLSAS